MRELRHGHLSSCISIVGVLGDGCQHWNKKKIAHENRDEICQSATKGVEVLIELKQRQAILYEIRAWTGRQ